MHTKENPHMYMDIYWHIHVCVSVCVFVKHKTKGESRESEKEKKTVINIRWGAAMHVTNEPNRELTESEK